MAHPGPLAAEVLTGEDVEPLPWAEAQERLADAHSYWLGTIHPDGRPHLRPVLGVWVDATLHISTGPMTRKGRNLVEDGRCALTVATAGLDLVLEGFARRVTDRGQLTPVADAYATKYGWPVTVDDGAFTAPYGAPTAGPPPYEVYEVTPTVVFGFGTDDGHAPRSTGWRF